VPLIPPATASGAIFDKAHHFALRVYFEDTDITGVVYHANYLKYFERARSEAMILLGLDYASEMATGGGYFAIADARIKYLRPAKLADDLIIISQITELRAASWVVHQRVMRGEEILAHADIRVAFLAPDGRPTRQPRAWAEAYRAILKEDA
jgi:acyl-CoA thioester hydrolase